MGNSEGVDPGDAGNAAQREEHPRPTRWVAWFGRLIRQCWCGCGLHQPHAPHWFIAVATFGLLGLAFMAWQESKNTTQALRDQLDVLKAQQRPYMYEAYVLDPAIPGVPQFNPPNGQIIWNFAHANYGHSVAYDVTLDISIKIGSEPFRPSVVGATVAHPLSPTVHHGDVPPGVIQWATAFSHEGFNKDYFDTIMKQEGAIQIRVEFHYTDASMKEHYTSGFCLIHHWNGTVGVGSAEQCQD